MRRYCTALKQVFIIIFLLCSSTRSGSGISGASISESEYLKSIQLLSYETKMKDIEEGYKALSLQILATKPVMGVLPIPNRVTSHFGYRIHPIFKNRRFHKGVDIAGRIGDPVRSTVYGQVVTSEYIKGFGNTIKIRSSNYITTYAHCDSLLVNVGDQVSFGDTIATVGNTGLSTAPHLHYEVQKCLFYPKGTICKSVDPIRS